MWYTTGWRLEFFAPGVNADPRNESRVARRRVRTRCFRTLLAALLRTDTARPVASNDGIGRDSTSTQCRSRSRGCRPAETSPRSGTGGDSQSSVSGVEWVASQTYPSLNACFGQGETSSGADADVGCARRLRRRRAGRWFCQVERATCPSSKPYPLIITRRWCMNRLGVHFQLQRFRIMIWGWLNARRSIRTTKLATALPIGRPTIVVW